jgi:hypothetical protein
MPNFQRLCFVLVAGLGGVAAATAFVPIDVESELNELDLKVLSYNAGGQVLIGIENKEALKVYCSARFINGPQTPVDRRVQIKAESTGQMAAPLMRSVTRVRVELVCDKKQPAEPPE